MEYTLEELISSLNASKKSDITNPDTVAEVWKANYETQTSPKLVTEFITLDDKSYTMESFDNEITEKLRQVIDSMLSKYGSAIIKDFIEVKVTLNEGFSISVQMKYDEYTYKLNQVENEEYQQYLVLREKFKDWN